MYDSFREGVAEYHLHLLCVDDETYEVMMDSGLRIVNKDQLIDPIRLRNDIKITLYKLDIFDGKKDWETLKENNPSVPGGITPFHYALASYFTHHLIFDEDIENCLYMDADLFFFHPLDDLRNILLEYSVGVGTHKHVGRQENTQVGYYNVGVVFFNNDDGGRKCLDLWKNCVIDPNNQWKETHGQCGDQKYLELFESILDKKELCIIDRFIGHTAPWNMNMSTLYTIDNRVWVRWETFNVIPDITHVDQPLLFHHFAHFRITENGYKIDWEGEWYAHGWFAGMAKTIYNLYANKVRNAMDKYGVEYTI